MNNSTILAFDYGTKKVGMAIGQTITHSANALATLKNKQGQPDWQLIQQQIEEWKPKQLVVGLPLREDGAETHSSELARIFIKQLAKKFNLPVTGVNEYLTSHDANARLQTTVRRYKKHIKTSDTLDAMAAQIILETWLAEQQ